MALRGLGAASDISEVSGPTRALRPPPNETCTRRPERGMGNGEPGPRPRMGGEGNELTALMQGLMGAQANDSGWPTFSGKYVEYPRFRKEWWAIGRPITGTFGTS